MKIEPIAGLNTPGPTGAKAEPQVTARDRAIAALMKGAPSQQQETPVQNPSQVSPEEFGAVKARMSEAQNDTVVEDSSDGVPKEEPKSTASEEPLSSQYAILARKEKAIRQRDQQLKAREAAVKAAEDASKVPQKAQIDESSYVRKDQLTQDPFRVLAELGIDYDQLTQLAMNAPKPEELALQNELKALREEIKAIKGENEKTRSSFEDNQKQQYEQAVRQIKTEAQQLVNSNPEFETIKETRSVDDVVELIERTFTEDGILLTVEDAAQQVEDYLVEEAMKLARLKKIQQRMQPAKAAETPKTTGQPEQQQMKTLTNASTGSRKLSARERALLAFEGKLGK